MACPSGFVAPPPDASWGAGRCYMATTSIAATILECVDLCAAAHEDAAPACITSSEENAFITSAIMEPLGRGAWLGRYRDQTNFTSWRPYEHTTSADLEIWEKCISGESPGSFQNWENGHSGTVLRGQDCLRAWPDGSWYESWCDPHGYYTAPCLCSTGNGGARAEAVEWLTMWGPLDLAARQESARVCWNFTGARIFLMPLVLSILLFLFVTLVRFIIAQIKKCSSAHTSAHTSPSTESTSSSGSKKAQQERQLNAARRSAQRIRVRVSGILFVTGWICFFSAFTPMFCTGFELDTSPVIGAYSLWFMLAPPGGILMVLAIFPTDVIAIRAFSCIVFIFCVAMLR